MFNLILKKKIFIFILLFSLSRLIIFFTIGHNNIPDFMQFADINLLKNELLETLFYLHSQPPFLNFIIGIILKITNGNLNYFSYFFYFFNLSFSIGIIFYSYKILKIFNINEKITFIIILFLIFNPNIIYYENYSSPLYSHLVCFLFFQLTYCLFKFFKENNLRSEIYIYINLLLLSSIWPAWQPYLILLVYLMIFVLVKKFNRNSFIAFLICFFIALIPSIKNKILFDSFSNSSASGIYLSTVFVPEPNCSKHKYIKTEDIENAKKKYPLEYFQKKSLWGNQSEENNLALIFKSKRCFVYAINRIKENPTDYIKNRTIQFIISHSKFGFENVRAAPDVGKPYWIISYLDKFDSKFKIYKQLLIFSYMMFVYLFLILILFSKKKSNNIKFANFIFLTIYFYYLFVTNLLDGGYEITRMVYGGFIMQIVFFANFIKFFQKFRKLNY